MITLQSHDDVLEILLNTPPVNALGASTRQQIIAAIDQGGADPAIKAIVIRGIGKLFSGGADVTEFGKDISGPTLPEVVERIEASKKPVIAAIHGTCFGGGLETALGCHYRIAAPSARLGLPEVKLGLLPGAGGTQRLPRLVGVLAALEMIVSGEPVSALEASKSGLVDRLASEEALAEEAIAFARNVQDVRRTGDRTVIAEPGIFERFASENSRNTKGLDAPAACIRAIKAATELPLAQGLKVERALFAQLMQGEQSRALRHIFFAERAAAKVVGLPKTTQLRPIARVGVIGAGTMGGGISMNFLSAGIPVSIVEMTQDALDRGVTIVRRNYETSAAKGRITSEQVASAMALLNPTLDFGALAHCDLIIEAVYENIGVKLDIFRRLNGLAKQGAMLASNTSYLNIDEMAAVTDRPGDVLGTHFFSPANVMKLVEVVRGAATAPDALATAMDLARRIRKVPVVSGVCYGFIGNRMLIPRQEQATALLLDGASPEQIDQVHTAFGMPMGPFQMTDLAGVDIGWHRDTARIESIKDALCAEGRWGQKTKAGFYDYDDLRRPSPSPVTTALLTQFRGQAGRATRSIGEEEIIVRTLYTIINEGAKILEEGIAQRASDIDVVWVFGYGWPAAKGGPMFWAENLGLKTVVDGLERYREQLGPQFVLSSLLRERAASGGRLDRESA
jgi:3-hydroxyacyl-CoA dehydrogenase